MEKIQKVANDQPAYIPLRYLPDGRRISRLEVYVELRALISPGLYLQIDENQEELPCV